MDDQNENENSLDNDGSKPEKMFTLKKWNAVCMWSWDVECDICAICRVQVMGEVCMHLWYFEAFEHAQDFKNQETIKEIVLNKHSMISSTNIWLYNKSEVEMRMQQVKLMMRDVLQDSGLILANDDIRRTRPIILRSISSRDLPWVSGT
uniref:Anaphase-promoting complex subunit 11 RING-H2 finger domain-containing protein n=1 Tax=Glossina pallidipes TaxID=7398 RepID=A0A1A9ZNL3_GLOPL